MHEQLHNLDLTSYVITVLCNKVPINFFHNERNFILVSAHKI